MAQRVTLSCLTTRMARGKLLQTPTSFEAKVGATYSYSYLVGEINAEFLDAEENLIATHRQSVVKPTRVGAWRVGQT